MKEYHCLRDLVNDGKTPKDMEYIFMVWGHSKRIEEGIVVTDVKLCDPAIGGYEFIDKETGNHLSTAYPWALMENTEENRVHISKWKQQCQVVKKHEAERNRLRATIQTLAIK